jgi:hypothetical protein
MAAICVTKRFSSPGQGLLETLCREIKAAEAAREAEKEAVKAKAQQLATALATIGVIRISRKV